MSQHPLEGLMNSAMENLKQMIDVNTIIGDPVETPDGGVILIVSKVGFGFAAGGSDFNQNTSYSGSSGDSSSQHPFGGGSGGGVSITPIAFLVVNSDGVKMLHLDQRTHIIEKLFDSAPAVFEKVQSMISNMGSQGQNQSGKQDNHSSQSKSKNSSQENQSKSNQSSQNNQNRGNDSSENNQNKGNDSSQNNQNKEKKSSGGENSDWGEFDI